MKTAVIVFPGSNCDRDMAVALQRATGQPAAMVWHKDADFDPVDLIVLPGGFSYGDYLRSGAMAAHSPVMKEVVESGDADYIAVCRALISDPSLPRKMQEGNMEPARCIHCNLCTGYCGTHPVHCYHGKKLKDEEPHLPPHMIDPDLN